MTTFSQWKENVDIFFNLLKYDLYMKYDWKVELLSYLSIIIIFRDKHVKNLIKWFLEIFFLTHWIMLQILYQKYANVNTTIYICICTFWIQNLQHIGYWNKIYGAFFRYTISKHKSFDSCPGKSLRFVLFLLFCVYFHFPPNYQYLTDLQWLFNYFTTDICTRPTNLFALEFHQIVRKGVK